MVLVRIDLALISGWQGLGIAFCFLNGLIMPVTDLVIPERILNEALSQLA